MTKNVKAKGIKADIDTCTTCKAAVVMFLFLNKMEKVHGQSTRGTAIVCLEHEKMFGFDDDFVKKRG